MTDWTRQTYFEDLDVGAEIPTVTIPVTVQRMVMEAGANRDFAPIHHNPGYARSAGAPDMYVNTFFIQFLFERTLREWMGLDGQLERLGPFRMAKFNTVGSTMACRGRVTDKRVDSGKNLVELEIWHENENGEVTVPGRAVVSLPSRHDPML